MNSSDNIIPLKFLGSSSSPTGNTQLSRKRLRLDGLGIGTSCIPFPRDTSPMVVKNKEISPARRVFELLQIARNLPEFEVELITSITASLAKISLHAQALGLPSAQKIAVSMGEALMSANIEQYELQKIELQIEIVEEISTFLQ